MTRVAAAPFGIAFVLGTVLVAAACSTSHDATVDSTHRTPPPAVTAGRPGAVAVAALPPRDSVSAHAPNWSLDLVVSALRSAGLSPIVRGPVTERFLGAPGRLVDIPGAELEVFVYGDAIAAAHDIDRLDTLAVSPRGTRLVWRKPPALVTSNNLVVIALTADTDTRARVRHVLGTLNATSGGNGQ